MSVPVPLKDSLSNQETIPHLDTEFLLLHGINPKLYTGNPFPDIEEVEYSFYDDLDDDEDDKDDELTCSKGLLTFFTHKYVKLGKNQWTHHSAQGRPQDF